MSIDMPQSKILQKRNPMARLIAIIIWIALSPMIISYGLLKFILHDNFVLAVLTTLSVLVFFIWPSLFWLSVNLVLIAFLFSIPKFKNIGLKARFASVTAVMALGFIVGNYTVWSLQRNDNKNWQGITNSIQSANIPTVNGSVINTQQPNLASTIDSNTNSEQPSSPVQTTAKQTKTASSTKTVAYKFDYGSKLCYSSDSATYGGLTSQEYQTLDECNNQIKNSSANSQNQTSSSTPSLSVPASDDTNKETTRKPSVPKVYKPSDCQQIKTSECSDTSSTTTSIIQNSSNNTTGQSKKAPPILETASVNP